ncbi:MAG: squalene/phytoene synthase family protein, partial [Acidobacteria bacterium]|nr:squalene/phytoene synthase family protein [Acidobacteriota bacterium]
LDTIEDSPSLTLSRKNEAINFFLKSLKNKNKEENFFQEIYEELKEKSSESDALLVKNGERIKSAFCVSRYESQEAIYPWVEEMGRGMVLYCKKMENKNGAKEIKSLSDLDDYCYYIAGTVGYMLTNLFRLNCIDIDENKYKYLNNRANDFGLALQKVNILKDIRDDYLRGWIFIPKEILSKAKMKPQDILDEKNGEKLYTSLFPLFETLKTNLKSAFEYLTAIPEEEKEIRLFLSTSLFFAAATIDLINKKKNDFLSANKLKISRLEVSKILYDLQTKCSSNKKLQAIWRRYNF